MFTTHRDDFNHVLLPYIILTFRSKRTTSVPPMRAEKRMSCRLSRAERPAPGPACRAPPPWCCKPGGAGRKCRVAHKKKPRSRRRHSPPERGQGAGRPERFRPAWRSSGSLTLPFCQFFIRGVSSSRRGTVQAAASIRVAMASDGIAKVIRKRSKKRVACASKTSPQRGPCRR